MSRASGRLKSIRLPALGKEPRPPATGNLIPALVTIGTLSTLAVGQVAQARGVNWRAETQPLFMIFDPVLAGWALISVGGLGLSLFLAFRLWRSELGSRWFGVALFGLALLTRLALNLARHGPSDWWEVFESYPRHDFEYLSALPELRNGLGPFLDNFERLVPTLPAHAAGHPPGLLVLIDWLGITSPEALAALTIGAGALAGPLVYALGRSLFDETTARAAALLFVFVPTSLLYGATSADAMYATLALVAVFCLLSKRRAVVVAGAVALALASFFSYALLAAGGWAGLVRWRRDGFRPMVVTALTCAAALVLFYAALEIFTGFDVVAAIDATNLRYHDGIANVRPYAFWVFGSPAAFLLMLGPVAWFAARSLASREITSVALTAIIVVTSLIGYTKAETERIWLFLVPLACIAASRALPERAFKPVLVAMTVQAFVIEILFATRW